MSVSIQIAAASKGVYTLTFQFSGMYGTFTAVDSSQTASINTLSNAEIMGTATVTSGTGNAAGVSGALNYTLTGAGSYSAQVFTLTGSGTFSMATACAASGLVLSLDSIVEQTTQQGAQQSNGAFPATTLSLGNCNSTEVAYTVNVPSIAQNSGISLAIGPLSGTVAAQSSAMLTVAITLTNLQPGTYLGSFSILSSAAGGNSTTQTVVVSATVSGGPLLQLSTSGINLRGAAGGAPVTPQALDVLVNGLAGSVAFTASASTVSGGGWLQVTPGAGSASTNSLATVMVGAQTQNLAPGTYFGRVDIAATGVVNSPQSVEVVLFVSDPTDDANYIPITVAPSALAFIAASGTPPGPRSITINNPNQSESITPGVVIQYAEPGNWLSATVSPTTIPPNGSATLTVTANGNASAFGVYAAEILIQATANSSAYVRVGLAVVPPATTDPADGRAPHVSAACSPTQLFTAFTNVAGNFQAQAGLPVPIEALAVDNCGNWLNSGSVIATFSTGDRPAVLVPIGNGMWSGTWLPHNPAGGAANINLFATSPSGALSGTTSLGGTLTADTTVPILNLGGAVVNGASFALNAPIAPGSFISIFGSNLAPAAVLQNTLPYPATLGGTQVLLGGIRLPLEYAGSGQINAVVPWEVPVNATMQLIVQQNGMTSMPEPVNVAPVAPAVFTSNSSGNGQGAIVILQSNGAYYLPGQGAATAGDVLEIYATGLGEVDATVADGAASPSNPPAQTADPVTVTIGGVNAQVLFAGLAPGYAGLYQVNVTVPSGISPGSGVPVVLSQGNNTAPTVTIAVQ